MSRARTSPTVALLGLGKAGGALAASLAAAHVDVVARARRPAALKRARAFPGAQLLFLAVPDDVIASVARELASWPALPTVIAHLSGARGLDALAPLQERAVTASFHPLASLDGQHPIPRGTLIAWDARSKRVGQSLAALARRIGCSPAQVRDEARALYHAGAVVAGNLPVALLFEGVRLLKAAGVPERTARESLARLLRSQADNAERVALHRALTGPIARGDAATLTEHLAHLDARFPELAEIYRTLSHVLVDEVAEHDRPTRAALNRALAPAHAPARPRTRRR